MAYNLIITPFRSPNFCSSFLKPPPPLMARNFSTTSTKSDNTSKTCKASLMIPCAKKVEIFKSMEEWGRENILPLLKPVEQSWQPQDFLPEPTSEEFYEQLKELRERTKEVPNDYFVVLVGNMITEEALPSYHARINGINFFHDRTGMDETPWAIWARGWSAEENRHGDLLNKYLYLSGRVDMKKVETTIHYLIGRGMVLKNFETGVDKDIGSGYNPYEFTIYTSFQERATFVSHRNTAKIAFKYGDTKLAQICGVIARDEKQHETAYTKIASKLFELDPNDMVLAFAQIIKERITMPGHLMYDGTDPNLFDHFTNTASRIGVYTVTEYREILEHLVAKWNVEKLIGLSSEGRQAQEYLCGLAQRLKRIEEMVKSKAQKNSSSLIHPVEQSWQPQDFLPEPTSEEFAEQVKELRERTKEVPNDYFVVLVGNMITEEALPSYHARINGIDFFHDRTGVDETPWAIWARGWSAEENRHGDLLNKYLYLSGRVDMKKVETTIHYLIGKGTDTDVGENPYLFTIYTSFQERATFISHRNTGKLAYKYGDTKLAQICGVVASDEKRHETAYTKIASKLFELDPNDMVLEFARNMKKKITMPGHLMYDGINPNLFDHFTNTASHIGVYTVTEYRETLEHLVAKWNVEKLIGLSSEGRQAQDYLCGLAQKVKRIEEMVKSKAQKDCSSSIGPVDQSWQPQDFLPEPTSEGFEEQVKELRERVKEIPDDYFVVLVGNMITEEALPSYHARINGINNFHDRTGADETPWAIWARGWSAEENRHGDLLNKYLYLSGRVDMKRIETTINYLIARGLDVGIGNDSYLFAIYTSFQERATFISHRNTGKLAFKYGDTKLAQICGVVASDEKRHETAYTKIASKLFELDPNDMVLAFADTMKRKISMPAHLMYDGIDPNLYTHFTNIASRVGVYSVTEYREILEHLVAKWNVEKLIGLSSEGRQAQDYLCGLAHRVKRIEEMVKSKAQMNDSSSIRVSWVLDREKVVQI
ncbi:hypothetical protein G4B88_025972 [Cannabis sativa]|uniref:Acyl-[acyl-carrier-protein] desaturase n=1 Tax=Cannabis sativa TaxID=3483 RepID=A0A7J6HFB5_CANSA|nr:hypothetical protein G4B88_025972 [Cannabis sativa]